MIIGVDVGTTAVKCAAFALGHPTELHLAEREYPMASPRPGWAVQDLDRVGTAVLDALGETVAACRAADARVIALALGSAMHGLIGLDGAGRPLTPLLTWADSRAGEEAGQLLADGLGPTLLARSGTPVHPMSPLVKLIWLGRNEPELLARARYWVGLKDWVISRLTGVLATELSTASGSGLLDLATGTWSAASIELAGIDPGTLPPVRETTDILPLARDPADRVGLPSGLPVVLGAGDGPLGSLGTAAIAPGVAGISLGTSGAVRVVVPPPGAAGRTAGQAAGGARSEVGSEAGGHARSGLFCYALTRQTWLGGGAISNGGSVLRWLGGLLGVEDDETLLAPAAAVPPGSEGLLLVPFLVPERAPAWDPDLRGAVLWLTARHGRGHLARAAVEAVALQVAALTERVASLGPVTEIRATGGVFRSAVWASILTDVLDRPITITDGAAGTARGAAALGLLGLGLATAPAEALGVLGAARGDRAPTRPDPAAAQVYRQLRHRLPELVALASGRGPGQVPG